MTGDAQACRRRMVVVDGRVQGVGFRASCAAVARRLGVRGWVRNRPDGRVEVAMAGSEAAVEELTSWCRHGPPAAQVRQVTITELADLAADDFEIR
jgi:acylphosphatase